MSISLLLPLGLAALAAWILPLLIHLVRRPEQTPYDFPALRWLRQSERPRRRLRFEDIGLLLLRLLLLALIALLLAVPVLHGEWRGARHWVLASGDIDLAAAQAGVADAQAEWRWLAPGFPEIESERPAPDQPLASLLRQFEADIPPSDSLTVLVPSVVGGLDAERIALGRSIAWKVVPAADRSASTRTDSKPLRIGIRHDAESADGLRYLRAALDALSEAEPGRWEIDEQPASAPVAADDDAMIWLGAALPDEVQPWIAAGGRLVLIEPEAHSGSVVLRDKTGAAIAREQAIGAGAILRIVQPLVPESLPMLLDAEFPEQLRALLVGSAPPPSRAIAAEVAPHTHDRSMPSQTTALDQLLCLLIALVFLLERIVAMRRRRAE
ncbi:BatA domain-containing protein [Dokdonella sp.]|uniref:BatA domain-containing protein n=1 Tax=Dokdonella sp. TaxID=2291710 RepID=UPI0035283FF3